MPNDAVTNLRGELRRLYKIVPANAAPEGDGMGQAGEPAGEAQTVIWDTAITAIKLQASVYHMLQSKLQALVYDILPSTSAVFSYAIGV